MARKLPTFLTRSDVVSLCQKTAPEVYKKNNIEGSAPIKDTILLRKTFPLYFENGREAAITFKGEVIEWTENGATGAAEAEYYEGPSMGLHTISFLKPGVIPFVGMTLVIDLPRASFTLVELTLGNANSNRDVETTVSSGTLDKPGKSAHAATDELTGKVYDIKFADDVKMHLMFENRSCSEIVSHVPEKTPEWASYYETFNPTKYVKIRYDLYIVSFYAPGDSGAAMTMVMNTRWGRVMGNFFGIDLEDNFRFYTFHAEAKEAPFGFTGEFVL